MDPKVSIIVPVYNVEQYLDRCVQSLLNQTLKDIEIILVDDGSPDNCPAMCDEYARMYDNIKVVHKENAGLGMACNTGIEVTTGDYIAFIDSDDWVDVEMYEEMYHEAISKKADMVFTGIRKVSREGVSVDLSLNSGGLEIFVDKEIEQFGLNMIANKPMIAAERDVLMSAKVVLYKRSLVIHNNIRFESERKYMSEDLLFNLDCLSHANRIVYLKKIFYNYFHNGSSLSNTVRVDRYAKSVSLYNEMLNRYDFTDKGEFKLRVKRLFIGYVRLSLSDIVISRISYGLKRKLVHEICCEKLLSIIMENYPINESPISHKCLNYFIRYKQTGMLILIFNIRNIKRQFRR